MERALREAGHRLHVRAADASRPCATSARCGASLAIPTVMNIVGPLANPAGAGARSWASPTRAACRCIAGALQALGTTHALVVHGEPGMDEISPLGPTQVVEIRDGTDDRVDDRAGALRLRRRLARRSSPAGRRPTTRSRCVACSAGDAPPTATAAVRAQRRGRVYVARTAYELRRGGGRSANGAGRGCRARGAGATAARLRFDRELNRESAHTRTAPARAPFRCHADDG